MKEESRHETPPYLYPSILLTTLILPLSAGLVLSRSTQVLGVALLTCSSVLVFFYNLVYQVKRIERVTGGICKILKFYSASFALLSAGYVLVGFSFISKRLDHGVVGGFLIVSGILAAQFTNNMLLDFILKGRRWSLLGSHHSNR